jgi:SAM domain (Sterile alpha motif)
MNLGDWLRSLGLTEYETAFRENRIDETVLPIELDLPMASEPCQPVKLRVQR